MSPKQTAVPNRDEDRVRALFNAFQEAILIHDPATGAILDANARAAALFGRPLPELLEHPLGDLSIGLAPCTQEDALAWIHKAASGIPQTFEWLAQDGKGRIFWVEMSLHLTLLDGEARILSTIRDIGDRKRLESDHKNRLRRAETQNGFFLALAEAGSNFQRALELIARHLAADIGDLSVVELLDHGRLYPRAIDQPYLDGQDLLPELRTLNQATLPGTLPGRVAASGIALRLEDPKGTLIREAIRAEFHPFLMRYNAHSLISVPLRAQGLTLGTLTLAKGSASRAYSEDDQTMLQNLADRAGLALTNAKLFCENLQQAEELRRANAELEARVAARTVELEELNQRLKLMAVEDALTGLANRRRFNEVMEEEIRRARRDGALFSLLMCDVDLFKRYNDHYGHQGGDDCLRAMGETMHQVFQRAGEVAARYGGEEFAIVLPGIGAENAQMAASRLLEAVTQRAIPHAASDVAPFVTLSIGAASARVEADRDADWFIARADEALYQSKKAGRNRVTAARI